MLQFSFLDGEFINASTGLQDVTLAGLTAKNTQVGLANSAFWLGDKVTSGLMGLAFPLLTHAFNATTGDRLEYDPVLTTMIKQGVMDPMFSLAFERNGNGGVLALGGVPPMILDSPFATTPILIVSAGGLIIAEAYAAVANTLALIASTPKEPKRGH